MIARTPGTVEERASQNCRADWQLELSRAIRSPRELLMRLNLPLGLLEAAEQAARLFPLRVPLPYLERIEPGNPEDPLLRQVLPLDAETREAPGYVADPLQELEAIAQPGLLHKYRGRVLLIASGACAINCRYCFRRHFPYEDNNPGSQEWLAALDHIAADPSIDEVILSGGDPLTLNDRRIDWLLERIEAIPQVQCLRIHTRLPIVIPQRVTSDLVQRLRKSRLRKVVVLHSNHPQEIDAEVIDSLRRLREADAILLNQAVLLRGVNDHPDTLERLSRRLFEAGVLPYYLHLLDRVQGAAHFDVPQSEAQALMQHLISRLPGYLVPRLVREEPGQPSKSPIPLPWAPG